jgi:hypothetical protein
MTSLLPYGHVPVTPLRKAPTAEHRPHVERHLKELQAYPGGLWFERWTPENVSEGGVLVRFDHYLTLDAMWGAYVLATVTPTFGTRWHARVRSLSPRAVCCTALLMPTTEFDASLASAWCRSPLDRNPLVQITFRFISIARPRTFPVLAMPPCH